MKRKEEILDESREKLLNDLKINKEAFGATLSNLTDLQFEEVRKSMVYIHLELTKKLKSSRI